MKKKTPGDTPSATLRKRRGGGGIHNISDFVNTQNIDYFCIKGYNAAVLCHCYFLFFL